MRADRLVAILLLLQTRGQVTAGDVARELEISERTARRDLEALGVAGLPVYPMRGRGGGWRLAGGGRTDLSGLSSDEVRALFLVAGTASATPQVKAALRKLVRALPEPFRADAEAASSAVLVDRTAWDRRPAERPDPPFLDAVQRAVIAGDVLLLDYTARDGAPSQRTVHPLGLTSKGAAWYLVADTEAGLRTFRVDRIRVVAVTGARVVRPDGFVLEDVWRQVLDEVEERRAPVRALASAEPWAIGVLRMVFGTRVHIGPAAEDGRVAVEIRGHTERSLVVQLAGFGAAVVVHEPEAIRHGLAAVARDLLATYAPAPPG